MAFSGIQIFYKPAGGIRLPPLQRLQSILCLRKRMAEGMLTKRRILVVIGIVVAILITFYTGVFGMAVAA